MLTRDLVLLPLLIGLLAACRFSHAIPKLDLAGKAYKLSWHYQIELLDATNNRVTWRRVEVEELHSSKQRRSILRYLKNDNDEFRSTYYSNDKQVIMIDGATSRCESIAHSDMNKFYPEIPETLFDDRQKYMIGVSKLLALVAEYEKSFKQKSSPEDDLDVFEGLFQAQGKEFRIYLYYKKDSLRGHNCAVPQTLMLKMSSKDSWLVSYNIDHFQLLDDGFQMTTSAAANLNQYEDYDPNNVVFDLFAFERALGCNKLVDSLPESAGQKLGERGIGRFSFETDLRGASQEATDESGMQKASVVYEPALASLRVHQVGHSSESLSIIHFSRNMRFHSMRNRLVGQEPSRGELSRQEFSSCVLTTIKDKETIRSEASPFGLGRILFGTDKLHYVGLARVRGIEARAYQWHGSDWPIWLQSPMVYEKQADLNEQFRTRASPEEWEPRNLLWRDELAATARAGVSMTNIFYFSKTSPAVEEIFAAKLLLVEVLIEGNDQQGNRPSTKLAFPIYDFTWDMPNKGPDGSRYEDSISLRDDCLDDSGSNMESGTSQMVLDVSAANGNDLIWLRDRAKRNVAILQLMQTRFWFSPISIIQQIDSKLITKSNTSLSIPTVIRAASRSQKLTRAIYHCQFEPSSDEFETFKRINFEACLMTVAHKRPNSLFAYVGQVCYMLPAGLAELDSFDKLIDHVCSRPGQAELYQLHRRQEELNHLDPLGNALRNQHSTQEILIEDPTAKTPTKIKVKHTFVDTRLTSNKIDYKSHNHSANAANKFLGIGLVSSDSQNMLVELNDQVMSFEACQTACIGHFSCRAFSVCATSGQMRCILSTVSFSGRSIVDQLHEVLNKKSKLNEKFTIKLEPIKQKNATPSEVTPAIDLIQVVKHRNCELHNKFYLDYFRDNMSKIMFTGGKPLFRPVPSMERCAQMCLERTLTFLRTISQLEASTDKLVANRHELLQSGICSTIDYISRQHFERNLDDPESEDLTVELKQILDKLTKMEHSEEVTGFCVLNNYSGESQIGEAEIHVTHEALRKIWFTRYQFDSVKLFEKMNDVSLIESELTPKEGFELKQRIREAIKAGKPVEFPRENLGWTESHKHGPQYCALDCLRSALESPLGCRSFEFFEIDSPNEVTKKYCTFNTVTLKSSIEANKSNLIIYGADEQKRIHVGPSDKVRVWHFDPRPGLFSESLSKLYTVSLARAHSSTSYVGHDGTRFGVPTMVFAGVILLVLGTTLGLMLGAKFIHMKRREEADALVEDGPDAVGGSQMMFANIVGQ